MNLDKTCRNCGYKFGAHSADGANRCPGTYPADHPLVLQGIVKQGDLWRMQYSKQYAPGTCWEEAERQKAESESAEDRNKPRPGWRHSNKLSPGERSARLLQAERQYHAQQAKKGGAS